MRCPICENKDYSIVIELDAGRFDGSTIYKNIRVVCCDSCGHIYNQLSSREQVDLMKYYRDEYENLSRHVENKPLEEITKRYMTKGKNIRSLTRNEIVLEKVSPPKNKYDVIVLDNGIEHSLDPMDLMRRTRWLLKDNGVVIVSVPDVTRYDDIYFWLIREHVQHFNEECLCFLMNKNGFITVESNQGVLSVAGKNIPVLNMVFQHASTLYCWGVSREFFLLYESILKDFSSLVLIDSNEYKQSQKIDGMEINNPDVLKNSSSDSILLITAYAHVDEIKKEAKRLGFKGKILGT